MSDVTAAQCAVVVRLADSLHIFTELQKSSMTAEDVSKICGVPLRQADAILSTLTASGYIDFEPAAHRYSLSPEQQSLFANDNDPLFVGGAFQLAHGLARNDSAEIERGISRSSKAKFPGLVSRRLGLRLEAGERIVEIGCGSGATLIEIARRYPKVRSLGVDRSDSAIEQARMEAKKNGVHDRISFVSGEADGLAATSCGVVLCLEALHEFPDPLAVGRAAFRALTPGGVWLIVEPCSDGTEGGNDMRFLASLASLYCLPASGFAPGALGPLADKKAYERVVIDAGFTQRIVESDGPIHVVIEATK